MENPNHENLDYPVDRAPSVHSYESSSDRDSLGRRENHLLAKLRAKCRVDAECGVGTVLIMHGIITFGWIGGSIYACAAFKKAYWMVLACSGVIFLVPILVAPMGLCTRKPTPVRIYCITACFRAIVELAFAIYAFTIIPHCQILCLETGIGYKWNFLIGTVFLTCCFLTIWWLIITFDFYRHLKRRRKMMFQAMKRASQNQNLLEFNEDDWEPPDNIRLIKTHYGTQKAKRAPSFIPRRLPFITTSSEEPSSYSQRAVADFEANFDDEKSLAKLNNSSEREKRKRQEQNNKKKEKDKETPRKQSKKDSGPGTPNKPQPPA